MKIDFKKLAAELAEEHKVGTDKVSIWGGKCEGEQAALDLVQRWPNLAAMPYRIWEHASELAFEQDSLPASFDRLERARLFGPGGDLTLRRDGEDFRWWFVGKAGTVPPQGFNKPEGNFWTQEPDAAFYETETQALLWGERRNDEDRQWWFEDRVAKADLSYPVVGAPERVQVVYHTFSRAGRVEFVWLQELREQKKEQTNGG